ncbi:MAG: helix-turn-helix transcriptional regulator [Clostridia bacterium]|nr:helix-turn-helix transcriptional regulator [Clostridia bacterium]
MISYEPFYKTLEQKGVTTYKLITKYNISRGLLDRLKHNRPITTVTLNDLCRILDCNVEDIMVYVKEE